MAVEGGRFWDESFTNAATLASNQWYILKSTGEDTVTLCTNSSGGHGRAIGVLQNDPAAAGAATVRLWGKTKVSAGGTITAGDNITCSTGGQAITAATTGLWIIGKANSASTAAGQIIDAFMTGGYVWMGSTA